MAQRVEELEGEITDLHKEISQLTSLCESLEFREEEKVTLP